MQPLAELQPAELKAAVLRQLMHLIRVEAKDAEVLAEFISVMVDERKTRGEMQAELTEFLEEEAGPFLDRLEKEKVQILANRAAPVPSLRRTALRTPRSGSKVASSLIRSPGAAQLTGESATGYANAAGFASAAGFVGAHSSGAGVAASSPGSSTASPGLPAAGVATPAAVLGVPQTLGSPQRRSPQQLGATPPMGSPQQLGSPQHLGSPQLVGSPQQLGPPPPMGTPPRVRGSAEKEAANATHQKKLELLADMTRKLQEILKRVSDKSLPDEMKEKYQTMAQSIQAQMAALSRPPPRV